MKKIIKVLFVTVILLILSVNTAYAKWAYCFVVYNKNVYVITDKKVDTKLIGSLLGKVTKHSECEGTYSGNFSNTYPKGTRYYKIKGEDVKNLIAVKERDDSYTAAKYQCEYEGGKYDLHSLPIYPIGIIIAAIIVWFIVRKKTVDS